MRKPNAAPSAWYVKALVMSGAKAWMFSFVKDGTIAANMRHGRAIYRAYCDMPLAAVALKWPVLAMKNPKLLQRRA
jgi:hypothetical protein